MRLRLLTAAGLVVCGTLAASAERIVLTHGASECVVDTQGARICSCALDGEEVLWTSPEKQDPNALWIHGGMPLAWPWYGRIGTGDAHIHGYAWRRPFAVRSRRADELVLTLETATAHLAYTVKLGRALSLELRTENRSPDDLPLGMAFHPYFRVGERDRTVVEGLKAEPVPCTSAVDEGVKFKAAVARHECFVRDAVLKRSLRIVSENATGLNLWNPGAEKDCPGTIPGDEWRRFVAVEPFAQGPNKFLALKPGESHVLKMSVSVLPLKRMMRMTKEMQDER